MQALKPSKERDEEALHVLRVRPALGPKHVSAGKLEALGGDWRVSVKNGWISPFSAGSVGSNTCYRRINLGARFNTERGGVVGRWSGRCPNRFIVSDIVAGAHGAGGLKMGARRRPPDL